MVGNGLIYDTKAMFQMIKGDTVSLPPQKNDRVLVSFVARVSREENHARDERLIVLPEGDHSNVLVSSAASVTVVERADDPSKDPIGQLRQSPSNPGHLRILTDGPTYVRWVRVSGSEAPGNLASVGDQKVVGWTRVDPYEAHRILNPGRVFRDEDGDLWFELAPDSFTMAVSWARARDKAEHGRGTMRNWSEAKLRRSPFRPITLHTDLEEK